MLRERFLATKDIMEVLGVSQRTALRIMHGFEAQKKALRVGRIIRVKESEFNRWVAANQKQA